MLVFSAAAATGGAMPPTALQVGHITQVDPQPVVLVAVDSLHPPDAMMTSHVD